MIGLTAYDPEEEDELVLNTAKQRKEAREEQLREDEKEFETRSSAITEYFTRMSWKGKRAFLVRLYGRIGSIENLMTAITFISTAQGKLAAYSDAAPNTAFVYDKILSDHDRMLDKNTLEQTIERDLDWLDLLDEHRQIQVGIDLMRIGGGGLIRKMYLPLVRIYNMKIIQQGISAEQTDSDVEDLWDINYNDDYYDPNHPASIEVSRQRKKWNEIITKYRSEVESKDKKAEEKKKGKKEKEKEKEKKPNQKQKGKKGEDDDDIDWFQLLPVWLVKRIFSYLDPKTLTKISKVNTYWAFAASGVNKERQTRKLLDSTVAKWKSELSPECLERQDVGIPESKPKQSKQTRRINSLLDRGAILREMVPKVKNKKMTDHSLTTKPDEPISPEDAEDQMACFPRVIRDDAILYQQAPCFLKGIGYDEIKNQSDKARTNIIGSLSNHLSTISISVETATLEDW